MSEPTLADFLLARIAEDEEFAKRAASAPWKRTLLGVDGVAADRDQTPIPVAREVRYWHGDHIARWDPARVLAECAAKRWIVEDYRETKAARWYDEEESTFLWVLRLLALPYADHEDYREEWRP